jgi:hypothetical protein
MTKTRPTRLGTECVSVHLPVQIKRALSEVAQREARTISGQMRKIAQDFLAERSADAA